MADPAKRWPPYMTVGLRAIAEGDHHKMKTLWLHVAKQASVMDKLRSTHTDEQLIAILKQQASTCFKAPGKATRASNKAAAQA